MEEFKSKTDKYLEPVCPEAFEYELTQIYLELKNTFNPEKIRREHPAPDVDESVLNPNVQAGLGKVDVKIKPIGEVNYVLAKIPEPESEQTFDIPDVSPCQTRKLNLQIEPLLPSEKYTVDEVKLKIAQTDFSGIKTDSVKLDSVKVPGASITKLDVKTKPKNVLENVDLTGAKAVNTLFNMQNAEIDKAAFSVSSAIANIPKVWKLKEKSVHQITVKNPSKSQEDTKKDWAIGDLLKGYNGSKEYTVDVPALSDKREGRIDVKVDNKTEVKVCFANNTHVNDLTPEKTKEVKVQVPKIPSPPELNLPVFKPHPAPVEPVLMDAKAVWKSMRGTEIFAADGLKIDFE